ncbi:LOW QUALITY PROTEIN: FRAS1-related extracellular matrix protein 1b [Labrus bergylta]|uniref:LOW QUALITY PROTEIN: FRAS1-related extracellular matrix protein 1b n=1 Tax=Labrus bergylta TaxID=56723 RepID=UPI0033140466
MAAVSMLLLLAVVTSVCRASLVVLNSGVAVSRGGSVFVTEKELKISVGLDADCKVEVVMNEPVTQRVGRLTPQVFDCSFLEDEVKYVHSGSPLLNQDTVMLRVYRFTSSDTQVDTLVLEVRVVDSGSGVVELGSAPLVVPQFYGLSNAIDSSVLNIRTNADMLCIVRLMTTDTNVPALGQLVSEDESTLRKGRETAVICAGNKPCLHHTKEVQFLKTSCQDFLLSGLKYQHLSPPSPEIDYIPLRVELREQATRALLEAESIWLPVLIHGAMQNQPPHAAFMASFILEVDQFILTPLTTAALDAKDHETPQERLVFNVTAPPAEGYIAHLDDHTKPIASFTWLDLHEMKVAYQPPNSSQSQRRNYEAEFQAIDGSYATSPPIVVHISIRVAETNAPRVSWNKGLDLLEGQSRPITWEELQIVDSDNINSVFLVAVDGPLHGRLSVRGEHHLSDPVRAWSGSCFSSNCELLCFWAEESLRFFKDPTPSALLEIETGEYTLCLRYIHDDSETTEDEVALTVTDGLNSADVVLLIQVLPMNDEPPQLGGGLRGELSCEEGGRVQVTVDYLSATDRDSEDSRLTYMLARSPGRGELQRAGLSVDKFSQQDLLQGHVYYVHTGGEIGPDPVSDTITLIISDGEAGGTDGCCHGDAPPPPVPLHGTLPVYDLNITILPVNNQVPTITLGGSMFVVDEGASACLCGGVLGASDPDSPPDQLTFHLETLPLHGFLENTLPTPGSEKSNAGVRVESFSLVHLTSGFINYVQSESKGAEPTVDQLSISVSDGLHHSAPVPFYVIINPTNDETPSLQLANFTVKEGGMRELTPSILNAFDLDAPPDILTFTVERPPAHGSLINAIYGAEMSRYEETGADLLQRSLPVTSFTLQELRQGMKIVYMHDDTETLKDAVALRLTDGVHTVRGTAQVTVLPVNDEKPRLLKNAGLQVDSGERRVISNVVLEAADLDTPPNQVFYFLNAAPRFGKLQFKTESGWSELSAGHNFTQDAVEMNRLWYAHTAAANAAGFKGHDSFRFTLSDLDNESPAQSFFISVHTVQKGDLVLLSKAVRLSEGQRVVLNTDILLASDSSGRPEELVYTVSVPPRHGLVHAVHQPGVPLVSFTQLDVAAHRVCYTHDNSHHADADSFSFVVTNGDSSRSGTLHFTIKHGDRIPPTLHHNTGLQLQDSSTQTITAEQLQLTDPDTAAANLSFIVTQPPQYGKLLLGGVPMSSPLRFTQTDVDELKVAYRHDPSSPAEIDRFYFLATDGSNRGYLEFGQLKEEPAVFNVQVQRVDRTPPSLTTRRSPSTVVDLGGGRYGVFITSKHLQASDPDSPAEELEFSITRPPHFGYLENAVTGAYIKGRFTQRDVDQRAVVFILPVDMEVTADSFEFRLIDPAGNMALPEILDLSWSRVELSVTCYRTCETAGTLQIQIQRSGKSVDPAYIAIQVEEGSAKPGRDFTHSTAALIQFDPGVSVKTWNIYLIDDGLEENHETFTVTLKNPKNAVLGQRTSARVEIIDPRGGRCDPDDLRVEEEEKRLPPPRLPDPPRLREEEDPVTDIEAELLWENQPHPPRGDVPNRRPYLDYGEGEPQDQAAPGYTHIHPQSRQQPGTGNTGHRVREGGLKVHLSGERRSEEKVWTFHSMTPLRLEELKPGDVGWSRWSHSRLLQELPVGDPPQMDHPEPRNQPELRQRKTGKSVTSSCPDGWTHYRRRCYVVSTSVASWGSAERTCSLLFNSSLTSVRSRRDMTWLWKFAGRKPFWIGLSGGPGRWMWADGRSVSFSRLRGAPPGSSESDVGSDCVLVETPRSWISTSCSPETQHTFICSSSAHTH